MKILLALGAAAVAFTALPAEAKHHRSHAMVCTKWKHGRCVTLKEAKRHARWNVGYRFAPAYAYTPYGALPRTYVRQYDLSPRYRYVYRDDYIYVVDPKTYAVERVIYALTH